MMNFYSKYIKTVVYGLLCVSLISGTTNGAMNNNNTQPAPSTTSATSMGSSSSASSSSATNHAVITKPATIHGKDSCCIITEYSVNGNQKGLAFVAPFKIDVLTTDSFGTKTLPFCTNNMTVDGNGFINHIKDVVVNDESFIEKLGQDTGHALDPRALLKCAGDEIWNTPFLLAYSLTLYDGIRKKCNRVNVKYHDFGDTEAKSYVNEKNAQNYTDQNINSLDNRFHVTKVGCKELGCFDRLSEVTYSINKNKNTFKLFTKDTNGNLVVTTDASDNQIKLDSMYICLGLPCYTRFENSENKYMKEWQLSIWNIGIEFKFNNDHGTWDNGRVTHILLKTAQNSGNLVNSYFPKLENVHFVSPASFQTIKPFASNFQNFSAKDFELITEDVLTQRITPALNSIEQDEQAWKTLESEEIVAIFEYIKKNALDQSDSTITKTFNGWIRSINRLNENKMLPMLVEYSKAMRNIDAHNNAFDIIKQTLLAQRKPHTDSKNNIKNMQAKVKLDVDAIVEEIQDLDDLISETNSNIVNLINQMQLKEKAQNLIAKAHEAAKKKLYDVVILLNKDIDALCHTLGPTVTLESLKTKLADLYVDLSQYQATKTEKEALVSDKNNELNKIENDLKNTQNDIDKINDNLDQEQQKHNGDITLQKEIINKIVETLRKIKPTDGMHQNISELLCSSKFDATGVAVLKAIENNLQNLNQVIGSMQKAIEQHKAPKALSPKKKNSPLKAKKNSPLKVKAEKNGQNQ